MNIKNVSLLLLLMISVGINFRSVVKAQMPHIYPIWGYNNQDHICQIKQKTELAPVSQNMSGNYSDIRECRYRNPQIIFYTGAGIFGWFIILIFAILSHYFIFPKFKKHSKIEKSLFFLLDLFVIGIILFFTILLQHFFVVPKTVYDYQSDIDRIIYSTFIKTEIPFTFASAYFVIVLLRIIFVYKK